jgi:hypothetical protein
MTDRAPPLDEATMKFGLLMESAQAHQKLAETHLEKLCAHTRDLDGVVRDEIRRTLVEELQLLTAESKRATQALERIRRSATARVGLWCMGISMLCTCIPTAIMRWTLPSETEISALRARRDEMAASVVALERQGGGVEWRRCGNAARLCVRVDRQAAVYGAKADFYVVAGH